MLATLYPTWWLHWIILDKPNSYTVPYLTHVVTLYHSMFHVLTWKWKWKITVTHCGPVMITVINIWVNIGSGNGLLPEDTITWTDVDFLLVRFCGIISYYSTTIKTRQDGWQPIGFLTDGRSVFLQQFRPMAHFVIRLGYITGTPCVNSMQ